MEAGSPMIPSRRYTKPRAASVWGPSTPPRTGGGLRGSGPPGPIRLPRWCAGRGNRPRIHTPLSLDGPHGRGAHAPGHFPVPREWCVQCRCRQVIIGGGGGGTVVMLKQSINVPGSYYLCANISSNYSLVVGRGQGQGSATRWVPGYDTGIGLRLQIRTRAQGLELGVKVAAVHGDLHRDRRRRWGAGWICGTYALTVWLISRWQAFRRLVGGYHGTPAEAYHSRM